MIKQKTVTECICEQCNYEWEPRRITPVMCPRCKSRQWNEPRASNREHARQAVSAKFVRSGK